MREKINTELGSQGYSYVSANEFTIANASTADVVDMADEWNNLEVDNYLQNDASFRERRFGRFAYQPSSGRLTQLAHKPYFQAAKTNTYAGGMQRIVAPLTDRFARNPLLRELISQDFACFPTVDFDPDELWHVAVHLFRIIGREGEIGEPTPEGVHRDDIDFGAMHLISRSNAEGGLSRIHEEDHSVKAELCLERRLDTLFWADTNVLHSVTPIHPKDKNERAVRDILIIGCTHAPTILEDEKETSH